MLMVGNSNGRIALWCAPRRGSVECGKVLLEANADVNKSSNKGWTALHVASANGFPEYAKVRFVLSG